MYIVFVCVVTVTSLFVSQHPEAFSPASDSVETFDDLEDCSTTVEVWDPDGGGDPDGGAEFRARRTRLARHRSAPVRS